MVVRDGLWHCQILSSPTVHHPVRHERDGERLPPHTPHPRYRQPALSPSPRQPHSKQGVPSPALNNTPSSFFPTRLSELEIPEQSRIIIGIHHP